MELKQGYKHTDVGVIPDEWQRKSVAEIASPARNAIVGGPFGSDLVSRDYTNLGVPVIRGQNMGGRWVSGNFVFVSAAKAHSLEANLARPGDIVFTQRGTLGQVSVLPDKPYRRYLISQSQMKVTVDREIADALFVYYVFIGKKHQEIIRQNTIQTSLPHINLGILRNIPLQVPRLPEQRVIAAALGDVDDLISALYQLIAKKRDLKQAAMQQLLTGKRRLPGFEVIPRYHQTEVGLIPEDWEVVQLRERATFKTGPFGSALHQSDYVHGGVPVINPMQIVDGGIVPTQSMAVTEQAARTLSDFRLSAGDVIIGRRGEMGRCAFVRAEQQGWLCGTGSMIIRTGASLDGQYIKRVLSSPTVIAAIENASVGSTMINLNQETLGTLLVPLPPTRAEQEAIATVFSDIDAEIAALEHRLDKTRNLKRGMMQQLLTGRNRLI